jgi:hypothetical protein
MTSLNLSGALVTFAPSIDVPVAEMLRTVHVMLSLPKLIRPALKTSRREALRLSPTAAGASTERGADAFVTRKRLFGSECVAGAISPVAGLGGSGFASVKSDLILLANSSSACI